MRALIVTRISVATEESTSLERQAAHCRKYAELHGWEVVGVAADEGVSATDRAPWDRPSLGEWIRRGGFDVLLSWRLDRVVRKTADLARLIGDREGDYGLNLASATEPLDTSNPMGRAFVQIIVVMAELEAANIRTRVLDARAHLRSVGRHGGGPVPWPYVTEELPTGGYTLVPGPDADRAREVARRRIAGDTWRSLADWLDAEGSRTSKGYAWTVASLRSALLSPAMVGRQVLAKRAGERVYRPVLSDDVWRKVRATTDVFTGPRSTGPLSGVTACGRCGKRMTRNGASGRVGYACAQQRGGCGNSITARILEPTAERRVLERLGGFEVYERHATERRDYASELADVEDRIMFLTDDRDARVISRAEYRERVAPLVDERDRLRAAVRSSADAPAFTWTPTGRTFAEVWESADWPVRRELLTDAGYAVVVDVTAGGVRAPDAVVAARVRLARTDREGFAAWQSDGPDPDQEDIVSA